MTRTRAVKILNEALRDYRRRFIVDANLYRAGIKEPFAERAYKRLAELDQALEILTPVQLELF